MSIPKFLQPYLASYDLSKLDIVEDKKLIITSILNKGDNKQLEWLGKIYTQKEIKSVVSHPIRGMWYREVLAYWLKIFDIELSKFEFEIAVFDLNPRPDLLEKYFSEVEKVDVLY